MTSRFMIIDVLFAFILIAQLVSAAIPKYVEKIVIIPFNLLPVIFCYILTRLILEIIFLKIEKPKNIVYNLNFKEETKTFVEEKKK